MSIIDGLIYDRTQEDVDRVFAMKKKILTEGFSGLSQQEKAEWLSGLRGAYNASDLNRVGAAVRYVAGRLKEYGYGISVAPVTNWVMEDIPTAGQMETYRANIAAIRAALAVSADTPPAPGSMDNLTYVEANNIEQILLDVDALLTLISQGWYYSGEIYAGDIGG